MHAVCAVSTDIDMDQSRLSVAAKTLAREKSLDTLSMAPYMSSTIHKE